MPNRKNRISRWLIPLLFALACGLSCKKNDAVDADGFPGSRRTGFGFFVFLAKNASSGLAEVRAVVNRTSEGTFRVSTTDWSTVIETIDNQRLRFVNSQVMVLDNVYAGVSFQEKPATLPTYTLGPVCQSTNDGQAPLELVIQYNADNSRTAAIYSGENPVQQVPATPNGPSEFNYSSPEFTSTNSTKVASSINGDEGRFALANETPGTNHYMNFTSPTYGTRELYCLLPAPYPTP